MTMTAHRPGYWISPLVCFLFLDASVAASTAGLSDRGAGEVWSASQGTNDSVSSTREPANEFLLTAARVQVVSNATTDLVQSTSTIQVFSDSKNDWTEFSTDPTSDWIHSTTDPIKDVTESTPDRTHEWSDAGPKDDWSTSTSDPINGLTESTSDPNSYWSQSDATFRNDLTQSTPDPINDLTESTADPTNDWSQSNAGPRNDWSTSTSDPKKDLTESTSDSARERVQSTSTIRVPSDLSFTNDSPSSASFVKPSSSSNGTDLCSEQQQPCVGGLCGPQCSTQSGVSHIAQTGTGTSQLESTPKDILLQHITTSVHDGTHVMQASSTDLPTVQTQTRTDAAHTSVAPNAVTSPATLAYSETSRGEEKNETNTSASAKNVFMSSILDTLLEFNSIVQKTTTEQNSFVRSRQTTDPPEVWERLDNSTLATEPTTSESIPMDGMGWHGLADGVSSDFTETTADPLQNETLLTEMNSQPIPASSESVQTSWESPTSAAVSGQRSGGPTETSSVMQRMTTELVAADLLQTASESTADPPHTSSESTMTTATEEFAETSSDPAMPTAKAGWTAEEVQQMSVDPIVTLAGLTLGTPEFPQTSSEATRVPAGSGLSVGDSAQITSSEIPVTTQEFTMGIKQTTQTFSETTMTTEEFTVGMEQTTQTFSEISVTTGSDTLDTQEATQTHSETQVIAREIRLGIKQSTQRFSEATETTARLRWPIEGPAKTPGVLIKLTEGPTWPIKESAVLSTETKGGLTTHEPSKTSAEPTWTTIGPIWAAEELVQTGALSAKTAARSNWTSVYVESWSDPALSPPSTTKNSYWEDFMGDPEIFGDNSPTYTGPGLIPHNDTPSFPSVGSNGSLATSVTTVMTAPSSTPSGGARWVSEVKATREVSVSTTSTALGNVTVSTAVTSLATTIDVTASSVATPPPTTINSTASNPSTLRTTISIAVLPDEVELQEVLSRRASSEGAPEKLPEDSIVGVVKATSLATARPSPSPGSSDMTSAGPAVVASAAAPTKRDEPGIVKTDVKTDKGIQPDDPETIAKNYLPPLPEGGIHQHQADADKTPQILQVLLLAAPGAVAVLCLAGLGGLLACIFKRRCRRGLAARRARRRMQVQAEQKKAKRKKKRSAKVHVENEKPDGKPAMSSKTHRRHQRPEKDTVTRHQPGDVQADCPVTAQCRDDTDPAVQRGPVRSFEIASSPTESEKDIKLTNS